MEVSAQAPALVSLVVRSVYTPSQSIALSMDSQTLIGELKRRLSADFPSCPPVSSQKLIFGGKICGDHESLTQVLAQMQSSQRKDGENADNAEPVVLHLLVSPTNVRREKREKVKTPPVQTPPVQTPPVQTPQREDTGVVQPERSSDAPVVSDPPVVNTQSSQPPFMLGQTPNVVQQQQHSLFRQSMLVQQQTMVLQQIHYLQYLLMQQQHQQAAPPAEAPPQPFGAHFAPPYGNFYGMMPPPPMFQAQMGPQEAQGPAETPIPAPGHAPAAAEAPVEPQDRPMLVQMAREVFPLVDYRMALKMAFMLFIIGQDTPTDRILLLGLLTFISYLHITGIFAKIYEVYNRRRSANGDTAPNVPADPNTPEVSTVSTHGRLARVLRISADRGFIQDIRYFVAGLLLSLVPAWHPQPIQGAAPMPRNAAPDDIPLQDI